MKLYFSFNLFSSSFFAALDTQYFGLFEKDNLPIVYPYPEAEAQIPFNRPQDCTDVMENTTIPLINEDIQQPTGVQKCTPSKKVLGWVLFPWVADTQGAGTYPGCANAGGATLLTQETSPAFVPSEGEAVATPAAACQNFVISAERPDLLLDGLDGEAPAAAPAPKVAPKP